jgi:putative holliday junction resolvase
MSKVLGIDFGTVRIGLALTDSARIIASPLDTIDNKGSLDYLKKLIAKEKITEVVVGEAKRLNGESSEITLLQEEFVKKLTSAIPGISIYRVNEMYTSKMAAQSMITSGVKQSVRRDKGTLDKMSAAILLQSWLDYHRG